MAISAARPRPARYLLRHLTRSHELRNRYVARDHLSRRVRAAGAAAGTLCLATTFIWHLSKPAGWLLERATLACCGTDGREQD